MSSEIQLEYLRKYPVEDNPYYKYFKQITGKGSVGEFGEIYSNVPDFRQGYGIVVRRRYPVTRRSRLGYGIGNWFSGLFQFAKPFLKKGLKSALDIGTKIANDVIEGENVKTAVKKRVKEKVTESLPPNVSTFINKTIGSGHKQSSKRKAIGKSGRATKSGKRGKKRHDYRYSALDLIP